jgi:hypothetical protein
VYQDVAECDDPRQVSDLRSHVWGGFSKLVERFADNLELAFDG